MFDFSMIKGKTPEEIQALRDKWGWVDFTNPQFSDALEQIACTKDNLVIMGPGGTGKSILLRMAADILGTDRTAVLSSTGISAANLSGEGIVSSTIHSFFKLKPLTVYMRPTMNAKVDSVLSVTDNILIDEVSMVNASLMDTIMHTMDLSGRFSRHMPRLILFGDILQLTPVIKKSDPYVLQHFKENFGGGYFFFNSQRFQNGMFHIIHLDHIYRQKDTSWQNVLNRVRLGTCTKADLDMINSRVCDERTYIKHHDFMMYLAPTNRQVDNINAFYYDDDAEDDGTVRVYHASATGTFRMQDNPHLAEDVTICKGMQVMCLHNDPQQGYQNGTLGIVEDVGERSVLIRKSDGNYAEVMYEKWEQYDYVVNEATGAIEPVVTGTFSQIGCKPAFACTIHKSQGLTLDNVYADFGGSFAEGITYVGLSRCTSLEGIGLKRPVQRKHIITSKEALAFLESNVEYTGFDFLL